VHQGEPVTISAIRYRADRLDEREVEPDEAVALLDAAKAGEEVLWLDVVGLGNGELLASLGAGLGLHPLWIEDVANVGQRPKLEAADDALLIVLRALRGTNDGARFEAEQVSLALAPGVLVTFQERPGDVFDAVRQRLRREGSRVRTRGADYLAYALADAVVEEAFVLLASLGEAVETLEDESFRRPSPRHLQRIHDLRMEALQVRRTVGPTRDLLAALLREEAVLLLSETRTFLRDVHDHAVQAADDVESLRELLTGLQEATLSTLSLRMNEVVKVLTVISTIFIPLTFLVGVYGMNFEHMPELGWPLAYPLVWLVIIVIGVGSAWMFRRRGWW
jgi:magnesium transporter